MASARASLPFNLTPNLAMSHGSDVANQVEFLVSNDRHAASCSYVWHEAAHLVKLWPVLNLPLNLAMSQRSNVANQVDFLASNDLTFVAAAWLDARLCTSHFF